MNLKQNPELYPLIEWWEKDGKQTVVWLLVAAVAVGGWYGFKHHRAAAKAAAASALVNAYTTEELEEAVSKHSGSDAAGALKLRLAKSYFDAGRYEEALAQYESLQGSAPEGFADVPVVGKAQCLEALGKYEEAAKVFDAFASENAGNYLALTAQLGAARAIAQAGDKPKALARIESIKAANKDDALATARIEATAQVIKRLGKVASPKPPEAPAAKSEPSAAAKPETAPAKEAAKPEAAKK